jgi:hypothetical protein
VIALIATAMIVPTLTAKQTASKILDFMRTILALRREKAHSPKGWILARVEVLGQTFVKCHDKP